MWGEMQYMAEERAMESSQRHLYFGGRQLGTPCQGSWIPSSVLSGTWTLEKGPRYRGLLWTVANLNEMLPVTGIYKQ